MGETMPNEHIEDGPETWGEDPEVRPPPAAGPPPARREPTTSAAPGSDRARQRALAPSEHYAAHLHETSGSSYLYCSMAQVFREVGPESFKLYLLKVMEDAGNPTDPIERMLIEQICLAHHNVGRLHVKAASAEHLEEARVYIGAAALLTGEFRRSISTLKSYREPGKITVSKADVVQADQPAARAEPASDPLRGALVGEVGSNPAPGATAHDATTIPFSAQPEAGAGRPEERPEAEGADARRARKAPRRGLG